MCVGYLEPAAVAALAMRCPLLEELTFSHWECPVGAMAALAALTHLRALRLEFLHIHNAAIRALSQSCPRLRCLHLRRCDDLTDVAMASLAVGW